MAATKRYTKRELLAAIGHLPDNAEVLVETSGSPMALPTFAVSGAGIKAGPDGADAAVLHVDLGPVLGGGIGSFLSGSFAKR